MKTRTTAVLAVCVAAGLVASLLVFRRSSSEPPPPVPDAPTAGAGVRVGVAISDHGTEQGWFLMASQDVARRTPPDDVADCRALHAWALREGALPVGDTAHTVTFSADHRTTIESTYVRVVPDPTPYPAEQPPAVRLRCLPRPGATPPFPEPGEARFRVNGGSRPLTFEERRQVEPGVDARFDVVVDLTGTTGPFAYRVEIGIAEGGGFRMVPVNGGDDVLFATEDGGGMGYWPATTTWTMGPTRTRTDCPAATDPAPDGQAECAG
ncbi:hypothetical protein [Saccharothrix texasensis]|uniref:Uncharacterized protein n=1 Tax=Saccharothrix texasensis TaxID=103734 RepID=A0A3N1GZA3_9PSEU|nr:hypothetical protein [Saccharothrix texasensis]ROP35635.1 hypothetical protein EDD40_0873 [Saccharothrix texasensis]